MSASEPFELPILVNNITQHFFLYRMVLEICLRKFWGSSYELFEVIVLKVLIARSLGRSVARSLSRSLGRSVARSLGRSLAPSVARSLGRSVVRSLGRPIVRSLGSPVARSLGRSGARSLGRSVAIGFLSTIGYSLLVISHWLLAMLSAICFWPLALGFWLLAFGYWLLAIGFENSVAVWYASDKSHVHLLMRTWAESQYLQCDHFGVNAYIGNHSI